MIGNVIIDFLHNLAGVIWIGGIIYANVVLMPAMPVIDASERGKLVGAVVKRFTVLSWLCIVVLIGTGIVKALSPDMADISQDDHLILSIKYTLFAGMLLLGIFLTFVLGPKMKKLTPAPGEKPSPEFINVQKRLTAVAFANMILGILVFFAMAWL
jgi:uncharacterized membrane protein